MEALGINLGYLIVQILSFAIVFITLRAWVYQPMLNMLEKRRTKIAQGLEDARVAAEARGSAEREADRITTEAQLKANETVRESTDRAEMAARELRQTAEAEIVKAREAGLAEIKEERNRMLSELRNQVGMLAIAAAQKLIGESLDENRQRKLLDEFFSGVKSGKVVVLEGAALPAAQSAEVTSALPLRPDEQEAVKNDLFASIGSGAAISFHVDPNLLGGVVVKVGDRVVDGSVAGQLENMRQSLR